MILFKNTTYIIRVFQVSTTNAVEVSLPVLEYNFSPSRYTLLFGDEHEGVYQRSCFLIAIKTRHFWGPSFYDDVTCTMMMTSLVS